LSRGARAAKLESFDGSRDKAEQFIQSIHNTVMMQLNTFTDEKMKSYMPSLHAWRNSTSWAEKETNMSCPTPLHFPPLQNYWWVLRGILETQIKNVQLHTLKMMMGMIADEYMAKFEMLVGRTGFNEAALEDAFTQGLPQLILSKVYSQTSLLLGLETGRHSCAIWSASIGDYQTKTVNQSNLNANPSDTDPGCHPHSRHLCTHGHQSKLTQT